MTAGAILAFAPDLRAFKSGRNFAAWLGLVPRQLIRWIIREGVLPGNWLGHILGRKPRMVAAVALANKMVRIIWAMMTREQNYRMV